jgi:hypothetical protein
VTENWIIGGLTTGGEVVVAGGDDGAVVEDGAGENNVLHETKIRATRQKQRAAKARRFFTILGIKPLLFKFIHNLTFKA